MLKRRTPMKKRGKKTDAWEKMRRALKPRFERAGITTCELRWPGCWKDNGLGFAHAKRRRNLKAGELGIVILCCNYCHDALDLRPEAGTSAIVESVIGGRTTQPEPCPKNQ